MLFTVPGISLLIASGVALLISWFLASYAIRLKSTVGWVIFAVVFLLFAFGLLGWIEMVVRSVMPTYIPFIAYLTAFLFGCVSLVVEAIWLRRRTRNLVQS